MKSIYHIAKLTFQEIIRNRIYGFIVLFSLVTSVSIHLFAEFSFQEQDKFLKDIGLACITFFSVILGIFLGVTSIQDEYETRSIYSILVYPITGFQFLLGKFFGITVLNLLAIFVMVMIFYLNLAVQRINLGTFDMDHGLTYGFMIWEGIRTGVFENVMLLKAFLAIFLQSCIISAMSFFLTNWLSAPFAILGSIFLFLLGHVIDFTLNISFLYHRVLGYVLSLLLVWVPNFENFNIADPMVLGQPISWTYIGYLAIYSLVFLGFFLILSNERLYSRIAEV